jgi:hypothetical protein
MTLKTIYDYSSSESVRSAVYNLGMAKVVYVQVAGIEKPARIQADRVEKESKEHVVVLLLKKGDEPVGEFKDSVVQGWWIQDE